MIPFERLVQVMERLRAPGGCPWDRTQTHESIRPYLIEETYEVLEAMAQKDDDRFKEELGDLLLQIVFHAQIAREEGRFDINDVIQANVDKLLRRHPHVFGDRKARNAEDALANWERIKSQEKKGAAKQSHSVLSGVPKQLPALLKAQRIQEKAATVGFTWKQSKGVLITVTEKFAQLKTAYQANCNAKDRDRPEKLEQLIEKLGDLLFALVDLARNEGIAAEDALARANDKFTRCFAYSEGKNG